MEFLLKTKNPKGKFVFKITKNEIISTKSLKYLRKSRHGSQFNI